MSAISVADGDNTYSLRSESIQSRARMRSRVWMCMCEQVGCQDELHPLKK